MELIAKTFSWKEISSSHRLMVLLVLTLGVVNFLWGEHVPAGGGFGWDGVLYAEMVRNLDSMISNGLLSGYHAQRILPSAIVRCMLLLSHLSMSDANIIRSFELYNLAILLGACWVWKRVSNNFSLSLSGRWIGFSGIFINFQCSKQAFYEPVLTDITALLVAMLLLLYYVEKRPILLFLTTVIGAFCWPVVSICGAFLLIFLRVDTPREILTSTAANVRVKSANFPLLVKLGAGVVFSLSIIGYLFFAYGGAVSENACGVFNNSLRGGVNAIAPKVAPQLEKFLSVDGACAPAKQLLTALPSLFGITVALFMLIGSRDYFYSLLSNLRRVHVSLVGLAVGAVLFPMLVVKMISNPNIANPSSLAYLIRLVILPPEGKFFLPIVTLAVFWGPLVLLLLLYWKAFCVEARKLGAGVVLIVGLTLPLGLVGEPRFLTIAWPFLVLGLVRALELSSTRVSFNYVLSALTILLAQFWMRINFEPWPQPDNAGLLEFPKQLFFMHYGLWMSSLTYGIQLILLVLGTLLLYRFGTKVEHNKISNDSFA